MEAHEDPPARRRPPPGGPDHRGLRRDGNAVDSAGTLEDARWLAAESVYDVLVLDVMLARRRRVRPLRELRASGNWDARPAAHRA